MTASVEGHQNAATINTVLMLMGYNLTHTSTHLHNTHTHTCAYFTSSQFSHQSMQLPVPVLA